MHPGNRACGEGREVLVCCFSQCKWNQPVSQVIKDYRSNVAECRQDFLFAHTENYKHLDLGKKLHVHSGWSHKNLVGTEVVYGAIPDPFLLAFLGKG